MNKLKNFVFHLIKLIFPSTKWEWALFCFYFVGFGILGRYIALHYFIIYDDRIPWDAYFSFDNRSIVRNGGGFERHPLANYFFDVIRNIGYYFSDRKFNFAFRMVLATFSNLAITLSMVQIFKYLKKYHSVTNLDFIDVGGFLLTFFYHDLTFIHARDVHLQFIFPDFI